MQDNQSFLSGLPNDVLVNAVNFLSTRDALRLGSLNSTFRRTRLSFSVLQDPVPLLESSNWHGTHDEESHTPRRCVWIPVKFRHKTHSVVLSCQWRDQGFGNRKGTLFVVAVPANDDPNEDNLNSIENGKIVYESPVAPHAQETIQFSFSYSPEMAYYLWYRVGGGGGHRLHVNNLTMRTLIYDDAEKWIGRNYKRLCLNGFMGNSNAFSLDMLLSIATAPETSRGHFSGLLVRNELAMTPASMQALEEVAVALQEHEQMKVAHDALPPPRNNGRPGVGRVNLFRQQPVLLDQFPDEDEMEFDERVDLGFMEMIGEDGMQIVGRLHVHPLSDEDDDDGDEDSTIYDDDNMDEE